ncbi:MAG: phenylacetate--CoA ligase [Clostridium sp.]|uniref:phenylacetate--CoA ligase family protein n=1 Tax=Clostridium sp. TaxID=1506 RepID=UPI0025C4E639|nr:phenylacetate--CoA ligase [Clostridium sp.]MCH3963641.1 phenylacetate--CoA ligase [Clostridium sp.]MCI1714782.1 phenylacetate--CoA ligase [Clostridium sp.]MCI1799029.1 phenylacetate--CoA ligase [Clostridium sp.]MCI1812965.1 phenylacetate--CoA ligase [Clostridium sp.]MCI1869855.1 phenylacetate--CoA ligase [Clostridium sp.]
MDNVKEQSTRENIFNIQTYRLRNIVKYAYENVPFYRQKFDAIGLLPEDIKSLEDVKFIPFTTKQDLRNNYPYGMFAAPMDKIVRIHASSGTTGTQTIVGYTKKDIAMWSGIIADTLRRYGVTKNDIVQISYGYGLFTGGLGIHYGVENLGASVIPMSGGNTEKQILTMKNFGVTVLACTPSYALHIYDTMVKMGISPEDLNLRIGVFGAEPWSDEMRNDIEKKFKFKAYDIYGLSEVMGPGVAGECCLQNGLHINEEYFLPEVIDPATLRNTEHGEEGELVFTTLLKEGLPILRYRTRDISSIEYDECECGCPFVRMKRICGRSDDMMIIRGVNVYPIQIEKVLLSFKQLSPNYMLTIDRKNNLDQLIISIELRESLQAYGRENLSQLHKNINTKLHNMLQIYCNIDLLNPGTITRSEGKAKRIFDRRAI